MKLAVTLAVAAVLALAAASPALAANGSGGAGTAFGTHHATMAQDMTGFTSTMNPGVMHQGFAGWGGM